MMNHFDRFNKVRELIDGYQPSRERSLAVTKLDECEMWLDRCTPVEETHDPVPAR